MFEAIRRDRRDDPDVSIRELAVRHGVHRRTVRQALVSAEPPARKVPLRVAPVLDPVKPLIDAMLREDLTAPRKQRHTALRVRVRLLEEHQLVVAYSTVRDYVRDARPRIAAAAGKQLAEVFVPQTHPAGAEAEVDFADLWIVLAGVKTKVFLFTLRLSYSGKAIHRAYATASQEAFLDGHRYAFEQLGGLPTVHIRYDNLKAAVSRVLVGRTRVESDRWVTFRSHYSLTELTGGSLQVRRGVSLLDDMAVRGHGASHGGFRSCRAAGSSGWVAARNRAGGSALRAGRPDWTGRCCGGGVLR